ncbi:MAG: dUTP diphosphatase [Pseudomonadota bacterium]
MTPTVRMIWAEDADRSLPLPSYETPGAAGADLRANLPGRGSVSLEPGARALIPTGLHVEIPVGYEMQVRPRSGLALKHGLSLPNTPGTIDSDYRGPLGVILINFGDTPVTIEHGDRIAQAVIAPVVQAVFKICDQLSKTDRASGGFGSTGRS